jgi:hypothetical protein
MTASLHARIYAIAVHLANARDDEALAFHVRRGDRTTDEHDVGAPGPETWIEARREAVAAGDDGTEVEPIRDVVGPQPVQDRFCQRRRGHPDRDLESVRRFEQPLDVVVEMQDASAVDADPLKDAVGEVQPAVEDRDDRLVAANQRTVDVDEQVLFRVGGDGVGGAQCRHGCRYSS